MRNKARRRGPMPVKDTLDSFNTRNGFAPGAGGDVQAIDLQ